MKRPTTTRGSARPSRCGCKRAPLWAGTLRSPSFGGRQNRLGSDVLNRRQLRERRVACIFVFFVSFCGFAGVHSTVGRISFSCISHVFCYVPSAAVWPAVAGRLGSSAADCLGEDESDAAEPAAENAAMTPQFHIGSHWREVGEPEL